MPTAHIYVYRPTYIYTYKRKSSDLKAVLCNQSMCNSIILVENYANIILSYFHIHDILSCDSRNVPRHLAAGPICVIKAKVRIRK